jgi:membrane protein DedA with SNARE-associated domain
MDTSALITLILSWSVIIFYTGYFLRKALKTQHKHDSDD